MNVYSKTRKSHYWNEDRFINGKDYCIVLDGATPLKSTNSFNESCWMVNYIKRNISRYNGSVKCKLSQICRDAYRDLQHISKENKYLPSASACWVEFAKSKAVVGILGDCEVTAISKKGEVSRLYDDRLNMLDKRAIEKMVSIAKEKNIHVSEARKYIQEILNSHRELANKPNGYSALLLSPDAEIHEKYYELDVEKLNTVYLYSDGFSDAFENLKIYSTHEEMFKSISSIDEEINKIVKTSFNDKKLDLYPRFKMIDDITVTKIDFNRI